VFEYPHCAGGRIVADVVRESKGHTEGLEPHVTEQLIKLMLSAKSPKRQLGVVSMPALTPRLRVCVESGSTGETACPTVL
jgi:hypothetical protein